MTSIPFVIIYLLGWLILSEVCASSLKAYFGSTHCIPTFFRHHTLRQHFLIMDLFV